MKYKPRAITYKNLNELGFKRDGVIRLDNLIYEIFYLNSVGLLFNSDSKEIGITKDYKPKKENQFKMQKVISITELKKI